MTSLKTSTNWLIFVSASLTYLNLNRFVHAVANTSVLLLFHDRSNNFFRLLLTDLHKPRLAALDLAYIRRKHGDQLLSGGNRNLRDLQSVSTFKLCARLTSALPNCYL